MKISFALLVFYIIELNQLVAQKQNIPWDSLEYGYRDSSAQVFYLNTRLFILKWRKDGEFKKQFDRLKCYFDHIKTLKDGNDSFETRRALSIYGFELRNTFGLVPKSLQYYLKAHDLVRDPFCLDTFAWWVENPIANIYNQLHDYKNSEKFHVKLENSLRYYNDYVKLIKFYNNYALLKRSLADTLGEIELIDKAHTLAVQNKYSYGIVLCQIQIINILLDRKNNSSAERFLRKSLSQINEIKNEKNIDQLYSELYKQSAIVFIRKHDVCKAREDIDKSYCRLLSHYKGNDQLREFSKNYFLFSSEALKIGEFNLADSLCSQALKFQRKNDISLTSNFRWQNLPMENSFIELYTLKAEILYERYKRKHNVKDLDEAIQLLMLALQVNEKLSLAIYDDNTVALGTKENIKLLKKAIQYLAELNNHQVVSYERYRSFCNYSKAILLDRKQFQKSKLIDFIPEDLAKLRKLEETYYLENQTEENRALIQSEIQQLFGKYKYTESYSNTEKQYLEYFVIDSNIYLLHKSVESFGFLEIGAYSSLIKYIEEFNIFIEEKKSNNSILILLKNYLIPKEVRLDREFVVIPDGAISQIPFEILIGSDEKYLLENHNIFYQFSIRDKSRKVSLKNSNILIFSPQYFGYKSKVANASRGELSPLVFVDTETQFIHSLFPNSILSNAESRNSLIRKLDGKQLFHFAGHAVAKGENSFLAIGNSDSLKLQDITHLNMNLDMAVLSACETGLGDWDAGEGVKSIGRAFHEAGCMSSMISLWSANDQSTSQLMSSFYSFIKEGDGAAKALKEAKLKLLQGPQIELRHPYYWSGFILYGNIEKIEFEGNILSSLYYIAIFLCIVLILTRMKKRIIYPILSFMVCNFLQAQIVDHQWYVVNNSYLSGYNDTTDMNIYSGRIDSLCGQYNYFTIHGIEHPKVILDSSQRKNFFIIYNDGTFFDSRNLASGSVWPLSSSSGHDNFKILGSKVAQIKYLYISNIYSEDDDPDGVSFSNLNSNFQVPVETSVSSTLSFNQDFVPGKYAILVVPSSLFIISGQQASLEFDTTVLSPTNFFQNGSSPSFSQIPTLNTSNGSLTGISKPAIGYHYFVFKVKDDIPAYRINDSTTVNFKLNNQIIATATEVIRNGHDPNLVKMKCIFKKKNKWGVKKYFALYRIQYLNNGNDVVDSVKFYCKMPPAVDVMNSRLYNWYYGGKRSCLNQEEDIFMEKGADNSLTFKFIKGYLLPKSNKINSSDLQAKGAAEFCVKLKKNPKKNRIKLLPESAYVYFNTQKNDMDFMNENKILNPKTKKWERTISEKCDCKCFNDKQLY